MNAELLEPLRPLKGVVATVVVSGYVDDAFSQSLGNMRSWCDRNGFHNVEWRKFPNPFVEAGRDEVIAHSISEGYDWALMVDADAAPFPNDALARMLWTAFTAVPDSDVVGAYCQLKGNYLPTIDTGTGTWEVHYPGEGILPVIRTGGHFLLVKPEICRRLGSPWFRTRRTLRPLDALAEIDNQARINLDGLNPLTQTETWQTLMEEAKKNIKGGETTVGEDSGFCDAVKNAGGRIYVNSDIYVGHVAKKIISPKELDERMRDKRRRMMTSVGVYE